MLVNNYTIGKNYFHKPAYPESRVSKFPRLKLNTLNIDTVSFSAKTTTLSATQINNIITDIEKNIKNNPAETACIIDSKTGKILQKASGDKGQVYIDNKLTRHNIFTHNHPEKRVPITLSESDIIFGIENMAKEIRAITPSGTWFSFKLPDNLSKQDANALSDIFIESLFASQEYLSVRDLIKINDKGEYLNNKEELEFISEFVSSVWTAMANLMQEQGYNVQYTTGNT
ncbi:MAG: hypothetical protein AB1782_15325 [Cyanobacteriota bacterium]